MPYVSVHVDINEVLDEAEDYELVKEIIKRIKRGKVDDEEITDLKRALNMIVVEKAETNSLSDVLKQELFQEAFNKLTLSELQQRLTR